MGLATDVATGGYWVLKSNGGVADFSAPWYGSLAGRGANVSEVFHFTGSGQTPGPDPQRASYNSFCSFSDPDGNTWVLQEVGHPGARE